MANVEQGDRVLKTFHLIFLIKALCFNFPFCKTVRYCLIRGKDKIK